VCVCYGFLCLFLVSLQDSTAGPDAEPSIFRAWDDASFSEMEAYLAKYDIEILSASEEAGQHHVVADGLLAEEHCSHLIQLDVIWLLQFIPLSYCLFCTHCSVL